MMEDLQKQIEEQNNNIVVDENVTLIDVNN
jgi:hypothetical protein